MFFFFLRQLFEIVDWRHQLQPYYPKIVLENPYHFRSKYLSRSMGWYFDNNLYWSPHHTKGKWNVYQ